MSYVISNKQLIVPAQFCYLPELRKFVTRIATKYRFSNSEINALTISVDEACTNIIKHGYCNVATGLITMNVLVKNDRLVVELIDQGRSFNPNQMNDPDLDLYVQNGKKGGLGIFIMKKFLDDIQYFSVDQNNTLRLMKLRKDGSIYHVFIPLTLAVRRLVEIMFPTRKLN